MEAFGSYLLPTPTWPTSCVLPSCYQYFSIGHSYTCHDFDRTLTPVPEDEITQASDIISLRQPTLHRAIVPQRNNKPKLCSEVSSMDLSTYIIPALQYISKCNNTLHHVTVAHSLPSSLTLSPRTTQQDSIRSDLSDPIQFNPIRSDPLHPITHPLRLFGQIHDRESPHLSYSNQSHPTQFVVNFVPKDVSTFCQ